MAARLHKAHQADVRQKIQASNLIHRLQQHIDGNVELTSTQIKAIEILLDRSVAKLQTIQMTGENGGPVQIEIVNYGQAATTK